MDANQNPPSEREWTEQEKEDFFNSMDTITGLPSSSLAGMPTNALPFRPTASINHCGDELAKEWGQSLLEAGEIPGIHVTAITPPESGWPVAFHCPICQRTTFLLSPWAVKPKDGDYWRMNGMCGDEVLAFRHNMQLGMKGYNAPIELKPGGLLL